MDISFDPAKSERNVELRGISFELATEFEWADALVVEDTRKDYKEQRFQALGLIGVRLHTLVFTPRDGKAHVISLRKANAELSGSAPSSVWLSLRSVEGQRPS